MVTKDRNMTIKHDVLDVNCL